MNLLFIVRQFFVLFATERLVNLRQFLLTLFQLLQTKTTQTPVGLQCHIRPIRWRCHNQNADTAKILLVVVNRVSKTNVPPSACCNSDTHTWMDFDIFGRNVTDKVGNHKTLYYATSSNLCFCTTWQNAETRNHIFHSFGLCCTHNALVRCLPERKKNVICDVFHSV